MNENSLLHIAVCNNSVERLKFLVEEKRIDINMKGNSATPLHTAAMLNSKECIIFLLKSGADINAKDINGDSPLHISASRFSKEFFALSVKALFTRISERDREGNIIFDKTAYLNSKDCLLILLQAAIEARGNEILNEKNHKGQTFLDLLEDKTLKEGVERCFYELSTPDIKEPDTF